MLLMTLWRSWHVRNEVVHHKPPPPIEASRRFLVSYMESIWQIKNHSDKDHVKGKFILDIEALKFHTIGEQKSVSTPHWMPPSTGWCKLNTDGSFTVASGSGAGMITRDENGGIVFTACRQLNHCRDALESELYAVMEGIKLALHWCSQPLIYHCS